MVNHEIIKASDYLNRKNTREKQLSQQKSFFSDPSLLLQSEDEIRYHESMEMYLPGLLYEHSIPPPKQPWSDDLFKTDDQSDTEMWYQAPFEEQVRLVQE